MGRKSRLKRDARQRAQAGLRPKSHYRPNPLYRRPLAGNTPTERYLTELCDRTFLSLWSYPNLFNDDGLPARKQGKELCDLLVVFENHVVIFSDKSCAFGQSGDLVTDWSRWYDRAIYRSAAQAWGAERWIRRFPQRVFLDASCTTAFPLDLNLTDDTVVHRVVVAHGAAERCAQHFANSSPSLAFNTGVRGNEHKHNPFMIGHIDPSKGYVHVFDDFTLDIVLRTLDTAADFVVYLAKKEALVGRHDIIVAEGEEELLEDYLTHIDASGAHDFSSPQEGYNAVFFPGAAWPAFERSPQRRAQIEANAISYIWDDIIERTAYHRRNGTSVFSSHDSGTSNDEKLLRFFAREPRLARRALAQSLVEMVRSTPAHSKRIRVAPPRGPGDPHVVLVALGCPPGRTYDDKSYREIRSSYLERCCYVTKLRYPDATDIIAVATEASDAPSRSEDVMYFDARQWTDEMARQAAEDSQRLEILQKPTELRVHVKEYPV